MFKNIITQSIKKTFKILTRSEKKKAFYVLLLIIFNGFIEVLGLALILPVLYIISDPNKIIENEYINEIYHNLSFINTTNQFILLMIIGLPIFFLVKNLISTYIIYYQNKFINNLSVSLIHKQYTKILNKDYNYFIQNNSNYIIRDIATIPSEFASGFLLPLINFTTELIVATFIIIGIAFYNINVFFILILVVLPAAFIFYNLIKKKIEIIGQEVNSIRSKTYKTMFEAIFGIDELKINNKEDYFIKRSINPLVFLHKIYIKLNTIKSLPNKFMETIAVFSISLIYLLAISLNYNSSTFISLLIVFATAAYRLMPGINRMLLSLIEIKNKSYVFKTLLESKHEKEFKNRGIIPNNIQFKEKIILENISFYYENQNDLVLHDFCMTINKNDKIGIVGESGSGKSTFIKILSGLINQKSGSIKIDEKTLNPYDIYNLRNLIGFVKQDFYLLDASLAENIAFGEEKNDIDYTKLEEIIELSKLKDVVKKLKFGVETNIGEFGNNLSGGQKQRIAIARALYKEAEILIFDEATSALDDNTESEIIETINNLSDELTIIMVTHRKSSLKFCNKIYDFKNGQIFKK